MFGLFGPKGWDALPSVLLREIQHRMGVDFRHLNELAQAHGLFHQRYFKRPARDFLDIDYEVGMLAFLVGSLGNQLAQREQVEDARRAFEYSLQLKNADNPAAFSLANLHVMQGNLDNALPPARLALASLWADDDMRTSMDGRKMHLTLARIVTEEELRRILGEHTLRAAREALQFYNGEWSREQREQTVYCSIEIGGPQHDEALREMVRLTEDVWFDAAVEIVSRQFERNRHVDPGSLEHLQLSFESMTVFSGAVTLAIACTRLNPNHVDAWVLAARLRHMGAEAGYGFEGHAFGLALEALERVDRFLDGDASLTSRDASLVDSGHAEGTRVFLIDVLSRYRHASAQELRDRAAPYLA